MGSALESRAQPLSISQTSLSLARHFDVPSSWIELTRSIATPSYTYKLVSYTIAYFAIIYIVLSIKVLGTW